MNLGPGHRYFEVGSEVIIGRDTFELPHWKGYRGGGTAGRCGRDRRRAVSGRS